MFADQFDGDKLKLLREGTRVLTRLNNFSLEGGASTFMIRHCWKSDPDDIFTMIPDPLAEDQFQTAIDRLLEWHSSIPDPNKKRYNKPGLFRKRNPEVSMRDQKLVRISKMVLAGSAVNKVAKEFGVSLNLVRRISDDIFFTGSVG
jgi:hypothetical protein